MGNLGIYYGATLLAEQDLVEATNKNRIELEYYGTEEHNDEEKEQTVYGIEVVKKEYENDEVKFEKNYIENVSTNRGAIDRIVETLKNYKVTPIALEDVLTDLLKRPEFQES